MHSKTISYPRSEKPNKRDGVLALHHGSICGLESGDVQQQMDDKHTHVTRSVVPAIAHMHTYHLQADAIVKFKSRGTDPLRAVEDECLLIESMRSTKVENNRFV